MAGLAGSSVPGAVALAADHGHSGWGGPRERREPVRRCPCPPGAPGPWGCPSAALADPHSRYRPRAPLPAKLFGSRWAFQSQKASNERASAAGPTVQKIQQVRQLTLAVIAVYLAIFGLLHFFLSLPRAGPFPETGLDGSSPNVLCVSSSPLAAAPLMCGPHPGLPSCPRGPRR